MQDNRNNILSFTYITYRIISFQNKPAENVM